jgi:hypothetical protein
VLSDKPQLLYNYFKQLFAQVTNPPIDCIREELITSAETTIGSSATCSSRSRSCRLIKLKSPILTNEEFAKLKYTSTRPGFKSVTLPILFKARGEAGLAKGDGRFVRRARRAIETAPTS